MRRDWMRRAPRSAAPALLAGVLAGALTGCGGGGGSAPSPTTTAAPNVTTTTVSGAVVTAAGTPAANYRVAFDGSGSLTVTTDGQGRFTITVPSGSVTGHDTLSVYDSQGSWAGAQSVTANGAATAVTLTVPSPPPPPALP